MWPRSIRDTDAGDTRARRAKSIWRSRRRTLIERIAAPSRWSSTEWNVASAAHPRLTSAPVRPGTGFGARRPHQTVAADRPLVASGRCAGSFAALRFRGPPVRAFGRAAVRRGRFGRAAPPPPPPRRAPRRPRPPRPRRSSARSRAPTSSFTCITLRVPRDHFSSAQRPTFDVTFGLHEGDRPAARASSSRRPAAPGRAASPSRTATRSAFDPGITENYDIVFFDQRGVGVSEPLQCPEAALAFYSTDAVPTVSHAQALAYAGAREDVRRRLHRRDRRRPVGAAVLRDAPGGRGPRGVPRLPQGRQARPLRRELRHAVRPDIRRRPPEPGPGALRRRAGRPDPRRLRVLGGRRRGDRLQRLAHARSVHGEEELPSRHRRWRRAQDVRQARRRN